MKSVQYPCLLVFVFFVAGCFPSTKVLDNAGQWLPRSFNPDKHILLIKSGPAPSRQARAMKEYLEKRYPYQFEFVKSENDPQYADLNKYRFVINCFLTIYIPTEEKIRQPQNGSYDFYFYDRVSYTSHKPTGKASSSATMTFKAVINTIVEKSAQ